MLAESVDEEQIIERVAAVDVGKAELVCCVRVLGAGGARRRLQEISTHSTMTRTQVEALDHRPVLRRVQLHQTRPMGVRLPRQRCLPTEVRLDKDHPAHTGQGWGVS